MDLFVFENLDSKQKLSWNFLSSLIMINELINLILIKAHFHTQAETLDFLITTLAFPSTSASTRNHQG